ncbi:HI1506-related protein [Rahnella contaminans]|uniref:HI1506-related protein n=1 Tax=Rahnella contaminans TaxID=2703882 RepID=UPI003C2E8F85
MTDKFREAFNVEVQSTRPDGYRRGGFGLNRGLNKLEKVSRTALIQLKRDHSLLIHHVKPVGVDDEEDADRAFHEMLQTSQNAGEKSVGSLSLNMNMPHGQSSANVIEPTAAEQLAAHIPALTPEQFTAGGVPAAPALAELAGRPVSAAERDEAWQVHLANADADNAKD